MIFYAWSSANEDSLAATLLQLKPEDLLFREMVYTTLCLAAGGKNIKVLSGRNVRSNGVFGFIDEGSKDLELVSTLAFGAHLQGLPPGTSPGGTIYWLDNVLVVLTSQLYRPRATDEGIARIVRFCKKNKPAQYIEAVLISVEHAVLVHVTPEGNVEHTGVMPLFDIKYHSTMSVSDRYAKSYLEKLAAKDPNFMKAEFLKRRMAHQKSELKNNGLNFCYDGNSHDEEVETGEEEDPALYATQVDGHVMSTFYALVHLFEAAALRDMPLSKSHGRFPTELYTKIIQQVIDMETRESLMKVSDIFRQVCQEDFLFAEGWIFKPCRICQSCNEADLTPKWFERYNTATGTLSRVQWRRALGYAAGDNRGVHCKIAIGSERNKRSLLAKMRFKFFKASRNARGVPVPISCMLVAR